MDALAWLKDWGSVVGAVIAAVASLATLLLNTSLTFRREQRKALWELELRRFTELEEVAGRLTQDLMTYELRQKEDGPAKFAEVHSWLKIALGRFRRYPQVHATLTEFIHAAAELYQVDRPGAGFNQYDKYDSQLEAAFANLLKATDRATNRPKSDA